MTLDDATAYAKARAWDGYTAYVMRKAVPGVEAHTPEDWGALYSYTHVVSLTSRQHHEAQGWEVVETYEPRRDTGGGHARVEPNPLGYVDGGRMYRRAVMDGGQPLQDFGAWLAWGCKDEEHDWRYEPKEDDGVVRERICKVCSTYQHRQEGYGAERCAAGVHDWEYGNLAQSSGVPRGRICRKCGDHEYNEGGVLDTMREQ